MSDDQGMPLPDTEIMFYQTEDGLTRIQVRLQDGTVWLSQRLLAELYQVSVPTINEHISTIYSDKELAPAATIRKFLIVQTEGSRRIERLVDFYSLDMIHGGGQTVGPGAVPGLQSKADRRGRRPGVEGISAGGQKDASPWSGG